MKASLMQNVRYQNWCVTLALVVVLRKGGLSAGVGERGTEEAYSEVAPSAIAC